MPYSSRYERPQYKSYGASQRGYTARKGRRYQRSYITKSNRALTAALARVARATEGVEKKYFDSKLVQSAISSPADAEDGEQDPATLLCLNCPAQSDGPQGRDGRQISMDHINVKGVISCPGTEDEANPDVYPTIFVALVLDKQTNAAQLNSEDVFENPGSNAVLATSPYRDLDFTKRFKVLKTVIIKPKDFTSALASVPNTSTTYSHDGVDVPFALYYDLKGMKVNYLAAGTTSVIGAIADNSIHVIAYASNVTAGPLISYNARLRFRG
uniref:Uncharacterized protein n=1 Tax=uncultured prokaryote TaxID=198431 RepID=A0A0H5QNC8_9ZZZZ|nr:hypothetical protein [uncultured prokaryote]